MAETIFVGLGKMGAPMAIRHAERFDTLVFDAAPEAMRAVCAQSAARPLADLQQFPASTDTVILMLPTSRHVEEVLDGVLPALERGALVIDMGSSEPASTQTLAGDAGKRGIDYLDAPVSGGVAKAAAGDLTMIVGGEAGALARALPALRAFGETIEHVGPVGSGHAAKALNNLVSATNIAAACEALAVAARFGIEPEKMTRVLNGSTGRSQASEVKLTQHILPATYASGFAYDLMLKDMTIATGLSDEVQTPVTTAAFKHLLAGRDRLGEQPDHTEIAKLYIGE